jgi:hypothetical protein
LKEDAMTEPKEEPNIELTSSKLEVPGVEMRIGGGKTYISAPSVTAHDVRITIEAGKVSISGSLSTGNEPKKGCGGKDGEGQGTKKILERLEKSDKDNVYLFTLGMGFAILAVALSLLLGFNSLKDNIGVAPLDALIIMLALGGYVTVLASKGMDILAATYDGTEAERRSWRTKVVLVLLYLGMASAFVGSGIRQWFHAAGNWVAVAGLIGFVAGLALMFMFRKSRHPAQQPKP